MFPTARPGFALLLMRVALAVMLNAFRHAHAQEIEVQVVYAEDALHLRIRDDGMGISPETVATPSRPGHSGLKGLGERAAGIGAVLEVWSRVDAGTEIEVELAAALAYGESPRSPFPWIHRLWQSTVLR